VARPQAASSVTDWPNVYLDPFVVHESGVPMSLVDDIPDLCGPGRHGNCADRRRGSA